jgi:hypothetical protein
MIPQSVIISEHAANCSITHVENSFDFNVRMFIWKCPESIENNREQFQRLM